MRYSTRLVPIGLAAAMVSIGLTWLLQPPHPDSLTVEGMTTAAAGTPCGEDGRPLTEDQVSHAVREFMPGVLPCVSGQGFPGATLRLRLHVACTGAIENVELVEGGDWPVHVVGCVQDRLAKATFPAHGLLDGAFVDLPMQFPPLDGAASAR